MNDSENICLSCGLCCNGTLIGFVQVQTEEIPALQKLMDLVDTNGKGFFIQPCKSYCDGCSIYTKRPKQCDDYKCGLLKSYEQKEIDFNSAIETIELVKINKTTIERQLETLNIKLRSESFYFKLVELKTSLLKKKSESLLTSEQQDLFSKINKLDVLLSEKFDITLD